MISTQPLYHPGFLQLCSSLWLGLSAYADCLVEMCHFDRILTCVAPLERVVAPN